jgi:thiamine biosynthesis lipoprotein
MAAPRRGHDLQRMASRSCPLVGLLAIALSSRAAGQVARHEFTEVHLGVATHIVLYADEATARAAARAAFARIAALEDVLSDWRPESELSRLSAPSDSWLPVSADLFTVLERALQIAWASRGAFDPTVGPYVALWREARRTGRLPAESTLTAARRRVGWRMVSLDTAARAVRLGAPRMRLDLGGIAKGYILGLALTTLRAHGVGAALIEAGGDVVVGDPPPDRPGWLIEIAGAEGIHANVAVSTSGTGEQYVEIGGVRYAHVVDPRTGLGVTTRRTVTVVASDAATADALATALVVLGADDGAEILARFPDVSVTWRE